MFQHWAKIICSDLLLKNGSEESLAKDGIDRLSEFIENHGYYHFMNPELEDISSRISEAVSVGELTHLMDLVAKICECEYFSMFVLEHGSSAPFRCRRISSCPTEWQQKYVERNYQYVDPVFLRSQTTRKSFLLSELPAPAPLQVEYWEDAQTYGVGRDGLCYVDRLSDDSKFGIILYCHSKGEEFDKKAQYFGSDLLVLFKLAVEAFAYCSRISKMEENPLSSVELEYLYMAATQDIPSESGGFPFRNFTNDTIQVSIFKKLGVNSLSQCIAISCSKKWFDDLPLGLSWNPPNEVPLVF